MNFNLSFNNRLLITGISTLAFCLILLQEYLNGGVATHYLLHDKDLPGFSNWLGLLTIPAMTWITLILIKNQSSASTFVDRIQFRFFGAALLFGIIMSLSWNFGLENLMLYMMLGGILLSLFILLYRPEIFLGFVLGMMLTFGAILPIIIGVVLFILFMIAHAIKNGVLFLSKKA
ncbi:hypothetical protein [Ekhidna sp. To15]|uniref:hypothetical protein n=1 Tax=Ekhidna sp. To15 TaxID=3395267 RepID=UPI003F51EBEC